MISKTAVLMCVSLCALVAPALAQQPAVKAPPAVATAGNGIADKGVALTEIRKSGPSAAPVADKLKRLSVQGVQSAPPDLGASGLVSSYDPTKSIGDVLVWLEATNVSWEIGLMTKESLVRFNKIGPGEDSYVTLRFIGLEGRKALIDCEVNNNAKSGTFDFSYSSSGKGMLSVKVPIENKRAAYVMPKEAGSFLTIRPSRQASGAPDFALKGCEITILKK